MKNLLITLNLVLFFMAGSLAAQDSLQVQSKQQSKYKNQSKSAVNTQNKGQHGLGFVDANGDGFNDNAPDADGDGIPNGQD